MANRTEGGWLEEVPRSPKGGRRYAPRFERVTPDEAERERLGLWLHPDCPSPACVAWLRRLGNSTARWTARARFAPHRPLLLRFHFVERLVALAFVARWQREARD